MSNQRIPPIITGQQSKHFNDGVALVVHYTRDSSSILSIDTVDVTYNSNTSGFALDCEYTQFLRGSLTLDIGGKTIYLVPRVRAVMEEVDIDLNGNVVPDNEYTFDGADYVEIPEAQQSPGPEIPTAPPAPKRKRSRWELLELD